MQKASIFAGVKLTNNEPLCVGELLEEFPKVLIALLVCRAQHLQRQTQSDTHARTHAHEHVHIHAHINTPFMLCVWLRRRLGYLLA